RLRIMPGDIRLLWTRMRGSLELLLMLKISSMEPLTWTWWMRSASPYLSPRSADLISMRMYPRPR
ncbi:hypothetical protein IW146_010070, partial [Coemansia sp. RSA 922]